ncbi:hypothetical protein [Okeania sp. KiyG1]|uniref:hypothetical protein n=1 Tax=Okeania sp. KiyG1 TaxID=2720165 RepID=UPI00192362A0|nr:hypothetical protein [Okeania sp. KiyG1]GGA11114.1 hypothetical protein CYANOKiyG1_24060 [Okeania sp. KiyG1]
MTVVINIWKGELPQRTGYNAIFGLNVGHASMLIINDKNPKDKIYISHRPQTINPQNNFGKDTDKKYFLEKILLQKLRQFPLMKIAIAENVNLIIRLLFQV